MAAIRLAYDECNFRETAIAAARNSAETRLL
jgi:hypothetical protein